MSTQYTDQLAIRNVPDPYRAVHPAGDEVPPIRAEVKRVDVAPVTLMFDRPRADAGNDGGTRDQSRCGDWSGGLEGNTWLSAVVGEDGRNRLRRGRNVAPRG